MLGGRGSDWVERHQEGLGGDASPDLELQRTTDEIWSGGEVPPGFALVACPECATGALVPLDSGEMSCPSCEICTAFLVCPGCETLSPLSYWPDQYAVALKHLRCDSCGSKGRSRWEWASFEDALPILDGFDVLNYGGHRTRALAFPGRRGIGGTVLSIEGLSGIAVGDVEVIFDADNVNILVGDELRAHTLDYASITSLQVAGRGEVITKTGGGWVGGGFGLKGAIKGAFMADMLNALTTVKHRHVETIVHLGWTSGNLAFMNTQFLPERVAQILEPVTDHLRDQATEPEASSAPARAINQPSANFAVRIQRLQELRDKGLISEEEFTSQRARILSEI